MSDGETRANWTDRELLVYILTAMEHSGVKLDYTNAPVPVGRNASGCAQRVTRLKKSLKNDMDALKNGMPVSDTKVKNNDTKAKGKRKASDGESEQSKKRGRPRKVVEAQPEVKQEAPPEFEGMGGGDEAEEEV